MKEQVFSKRILVFALTLAFASTGIAVQHTNVDAASTKTLKSVTLKANSKKVSGKTLTLKQGEKVSVKVSVKPSAAKKSISYKSSNKNIAKVNKKGIITAKKVGTSKITVTVTDKDKKKKSAYLKVNVEQQKQEIESTNTAPDTTTPPSTTTPTNTPHNEQESGVSVTNWEDRIKSWQYSTLEFNGNVYHGDSFCIEQALLGKSLGNAVVSGIDDSNIRRTASVEVYEISSINNVCAIAVKFNEKESYVYVNSLYKPDTLETFIKDLSLKENLQIGTVYDSKSNQLEGIKSEDVFEVLFADAKNVVRVENVDQTQYKRIMSMSVNLPQLGCNNLALTLLEGGYVTTNVMCYIGQTFYVGTEKVDAFVTYILKNAIPSNDTVSDTTSNPEKAPVIDWENQIESWKYGTLEVNGIVYKGSAFCVDATNLGNCLGRGNVSGVDDSNNTRTTSVDVYEISDISSTYALAVKFNEKECYVYGNGSYNAETLEEFIEDLSLEDNLVIGTVYQSEVNEAGERIDKEYKGLTVSDVFDTLFTDAKNTPSIDNVEGTQFKKIMGISIDVPKLGCSNLSLTLLEGGYISTNILHFGQTFYVGTEKVDALVNYILQNSEIDLVEASAKPNVNQVENSVEKSKE